MVARREGISASQVSRVIHQLEDALGQQLFYRNTRAIMPTESGHLFVRYARAMAGNMEDARRELDERAREPSGTLRINGPVFSDKGTSRRACRGFWRVTLVSPLN